MRNFKELMVFPIKYSLKICLDNKFFSSFIKLFSSKNINWDLLDINEIKRTSETVFVMGSGYSINSIDKSEWINFKKQGEILSFNLFFKGQFVPIDYQIVRELGRRITHSPLIHKMRKRLDECYSEMVTNPCFSDAKYFVLNDPKAANINLSLYSLNVFNGTEICFFENLQDETIQGEKIGLPSKDITKIPHNGATLFDAINIAYILGYKKIVLVGVDLYDRRYFWLNEDETLQGDKDRGASHKDIHATSNFVLKTMDKWNEYLESEGVELYVYNPKSLLNGVLPLYEIDQE